jgi:aldose 1-epimerase
MREISSPSGVQWEIASGRHRAAIVEVGGGVRAYEVDGDEILDGYSADEMCPGGAGQILAPWPNRVRDGRYRFDGGSYQLALSEPDRHNAVHGLTRWLRWRPTDVSESAVTVECDLAPHPGYPWPLRLRNTWSVSDAGLRVDHEVTNDGDTSCPFGLGAHPYLHMSGVAVDDLTLTLPAHNRILLDGRLLPIGAAKVAGGPFDFTEGRRIGEAVLDTAFGDVTHDAHGICTAILAAPGDSRTREIWADRAFGWWQVFTGDTLHGERLRRSVAIEPMTCPPDALRSGRNLATIEPGAVWRGTWGVRGGVR